MLHNLLFPQLKGTWKEINLEQEAIKVNFNDPNPLTNPDICAEWVWGLHDHYKCDYSYGGYLEDRKTLWRGHYHEPNQTVHVGVDINVPENELVFMPFNAELITIEKDPNQNGGWGTRLIFKYNDLYVIIAHLGWNEKVTKYFFDNSWKLWEKGQLIGTVGTPKENGGWFPHIHVQCMKNYDIAADGYFQPFDNLQELFPNPYETIK